MPHLQFHRHSPQTLSSKPHFLERCLCSPFSTLSHPRLLRAQATPPCLLAAGQGRPWLSWVFLDSPTCNYHVYLNPPRVGKIKGCFFHILSGAQVSLVGRTGAHLVNAYWPAGIPTPRGPIHCSQVQRGRPKGVVLLCIGASPAQVSSFEFHSIFGRRPF